VGGFNRNRWRPLETPTQVKQLFIKGNPVDLGNKQERLYGKYLNRP